jgi:uncharacterized protein (DUF488 family)
VTTVYTIGHSNHPEEHFLGLLRQHAIQAVADVRSSPYSRYTPHFDRESLQKSLARAGIRYVFLGQELGARSDDPAATPTAGSSSRGSPARRCFRAAWPASAAVWRGIASR